MAPTPTGERVWLSDPRSDPPEPAPGCDVCGALIKQWRMASAPASPAYDPSHAVDLAVEMGRHPHAKGEGEWTRS